MLTPSIALLGAVAGFTIFLGLPVARMSVAPRTRGLLNALAVGILLFLLVEVVVKGWEPVEASFVALQAGTGTLAYAALTFVLFAVGLCVGLLSLVWFEGRFLRSTAPASASARDAAPRPDTADAWPTTPEAKGAASPEHPGAALPSEPRAGSPGSVQVVAIRPQGFASSGGQVTVLPVGMDPQASRLAMMIAVGIGLHNLSEGLAIGASAASGELAFALLLAVGFALHNATEGFGIAAPLTGTKPTWGFLAVAGLVAGGPTFIGTLVGAEFTSPLAHVLFLSLAAGSLFYVIKELLQHGRRLGEGRDALPMMAAVAAGLLLGLGTDLVVTLAGA